MSLRIQVVDDSSTIQKVIKIAFGPYDVVVVTSGSYVEALTEIQSHTPDLLIVDANISGSKTLEDIAKLHSEANNAPVLILRGSYDGMDEKSFEREGFTHILRKPFESSDIVREAGKLIQIKALESELTPPPPQVRDNSEPRSNNSEMFMDLSDTAGHSVPLPPPVREKKQSADSQQDRDKDDLPGSFKLDDDQDTFLGEESSQVAPPVDFRVDLEPKENANTPPPPPAGIPTSNLRGKKAFQSPMEPSIPRPGEISPSMETDSSVLADFRGELADIRLEIARQMHEQLPKLVKESVESYCAIHFPKIAREIVTAELRRLADEKARHLIDN